MNHFIDYFANSLLPMFGASLITLVLGLFGFVRWYGKSYLNSKFDEKLEASKAEFQKDVEFQKAYFQRSIFASNSLSAKEFECLEESWKLMKIACGAANKINSAAREYPDWRKAREADKKEYCNLYGLDVDRLTEIDESRDPQKEFITAVNWRELNDAHRFHVDFRNYILTKEIFLDETTHANLLNLSKKLSEALLEREFVLMDQDYVGPRENRFGSWGKAKALNKELNGMQGDVGKLVRERLLELSKF